MTCYIFFCEPHKEPEKLLILYWMVWISFQIISQPFWAITEDIDLLGTNSELIQDHHHKTQRFPESIPKDPKIV
jgi:hypothetical protein